MIGDDVRSTARDKDLKGYAHAAKLAKSFADPVRLEILDALSQGARTVDSLAQVCDLPLKNVSHHLQKLYGAGLVSRVKLGRKSIYSISNDAVASFWGVFRQFSVNLSAPTQELAADQFGEGITAEHLARLLAHDRVTVIDVRPVEEYMSGHLPGALSIPVEDLQRQIAKLPQNKPVVAFCRGPYCKLADRTVDMLKKAGFEALRCADGVIEWKSRGMSIEVESDS